MIDPVIQTLLSLGFSLLFLVAGTHKLSNRLRFQGIVEAYQVLPRSWAPLIVITIGVIETALGIGWLIGNSILAHLFSTILLSIYVVVISINLSRGRTYIDCGCGLSEKTTPLDRLKEDIVLLISSFIIKFRDKISFFLNINN